MEAPVDRAYLYITQRCNMKCRHCWVEADPSAQTDEVDCGVYIGTLQKLTGLGLRHVKITGGEPFVRKNDAFRLLDWCSERDIGVSIETNGTLLSDHDLDTLAEHKCAVSVSLDYPSANDFDDFRRSPGAFDRVIRTIRRLVAHGKPVVVLCTVVRNNLELMTELARFVIEDLHASIKFSPCAAMGRAATELNDMLLGPGEILTMCDRLLSLSEQYPGKIACILPFALVPPTKLDVIGIGICEISRVIGILPNGDVSICGMGLTQPGTILGNITRDDIVNLWLTNPVLKELRERSRRFEGVCGKCLFERYCANVCPAEAYVCYGDYYGPNPLCQMLHSKGMFPKHFLLR